MHESHLRDRIKLLATKIERQLQAGDYKHCAVYEDELKGLWPLNDKDRKIKLARFAKSHGFRLRFYQKGLCAIFDKQSLNGDLSPQVRRRRSPQNPDAIIPEKHGSPTNTVLGEFAALRKLVI